MVYISTTWNFRGLIKKKQHTIFPNLNSVPLEQQLRESNGWKLENLMLRKVEKIAKSPWRAGMVPEPLPPQVQAPGTAQPACTKLVPRSSREQTLVHVLYRQADIKDEGLGQGGDNRETHGGAVVNVSHEEWEVSTPPHTVLKPY